MNLKLSANGIDGRGIREAGAVAIGRGIKEGVGLPLFASVDVGFERGACFVLVPVVVDGTVNR